MRIFRKTKKKKNNTRHFIVSDVLFMIIKKTKAIHNSKNYFFHFESVARKRRCSYFRVKRIKEESEVFPSSSDPVSNSFHWNFFEYFNFISKPGFQKSATYTGEKKIH